MGWTKVTSLPSQQEADLFAGRLRAAGIKAKVKRGSEGALGWLSSTGNAVGPADVYVPADQTSRARRILAESGSAEPGSADRTHQRTILLVGRALLALALAAMGVALVLSALN